MRAARAPLPCALLVLLPACAPGPPPDIVLVSLDTVRADHLDAYGYGRPTAPRLAALASRGWLFRNAYSQETNTQPSHASVFTGRYPPQHGALENGMPLPPGLPTLAEALRGGGWATAAFVSGWPLRRSLSSLDRGFEIYDDDLVEARRAANETLTRALSWWRSTAGRPRFLFVHFYDAHLPYAPTPDHARRFRSPEPGPPARLHASYKRMLRAYGEPTPLLGTQEISDAYDAAIRTIDDSLGELLDEVNLERTIVTVFADHGETLDERYWQFDHGAQLFDEQIRVPLVISAPTLAAEEIERLVELVDLYPTILRLAGLSPPARSRPAGHDLLAVAAGTIERPQLTLASARPVAERHADRGYALDVHRWRIQSLRTPRWKLILYPGVERDYEELFDLATDPDETRPLPADHLPPADEPLRKVLRRYSSLGERSARPPDLSDEDTEKLRALGYLQ